MVRSGDGRKVSRVEDRSSIEEWRGRWCPWQGSLRAWRWLNDVGRSRPRPNHPISIVEGWRWPQHHLPSSSPPKPPPEKTGSESRMSRRVTGEATPASAVCRTRRHASRWCRHVRRAGSSTRLISTKISCWGYLGRRAINPVRPRTQRCIPSLMSLPRTFVR